MSGLVALLWLVFETVGPNGWILSQQLTADDLTARLPTAELAARTPDVWVIYHEQDDWSTAFYVAPGGEVISGPLAALIDQDALPRLLPKLKVPRLFLYKPYHWRDGAPVEVETMALDVSEYYANALLEAWLSLRCGNASQDALCALLQQRADELWQSAPEDQRLAVHLGALADFGSHLFSVAGELRRSLARARALGRDPCPAVRHPRTLYGQWPKIFREHAFPGRFQQHPEGRTSGGPWVTTPESLQTSDKEMLVKYVFADFWTGDVLRDFELECPLTD